MYHGHIQIFKQIQIQQLQIQIQMEIQITSIRQSPVVTAQYATTATPPAPMWFGILRFVLFQNASQILQKRSSSSRECAGPSYSQFSNIIIIIIIITIIIIIIIIKRMCRPSHSHLSKRPRALCYSRTTWRNLPAWSSKEEKGGFSPFFVGVKHRGD